MKAKIILFFILTLTLFEGCRNTREFKNVLFDYESNQTLKVYENKSDSYVINDGPYKGYPSIDYFTTIIFQNGAKKELQKNEFIIATSKGNLITKEFNVISSKTKYSSYQISFNSLRPLSQIEFKGEQKIDILENGAITVCDQWELYGTTIGVYNIHFKLLNKFKPFESGYKNALVTASGNKIIAIVCKEEPDPKTEYFELDASTGFIILQRELEKNLNPVKVESFGNKSIVIENTKILAITDGRISWEKNIVLPNYDIVINASQNAIYYCTANRLVKLSANNGEELFSKNLLEIYGNVTDTTNLMLRPIVFKTMENNGTTFILLAETNRGTLLNSIPKLNPKLFSIDDSGSILENKKINLQTFDWVDFYETRDRKLILVTNKQQIEIL